MGHALSIASGIATAQPSRPVFALMAIVDDHALRVITNNCEFKQKNLLHIVLNNGVQNLLAVSLLLDTKSALPLLREKRGTIQCPFM